MRYGLSLHPVGRQPTVGDYVYLAELAERLQFDTLWHFDHVVIPKVFDQNAYRQYYDSDFPLTADDPFFEPITTLAFLAGKVTTPRLGLAVLMLPKPGGAPMIRSETKTLPQSAIKHAGRPKNGNRESKRRRDIL